MRRFALIIGLIGCQGAGEVPALGSRSQAIVNGRRAGANETWSTVALVDAEGYTFCTGTLVAPTVVVTAAHCFQDENGRPLSVGQVQVAGGILDAYPAPAARRRAAARIVPHPRFTLEPIAGPASGIGRDHDIGVVLLQQGIFDVPPAPIMPSGRLGQLVPNQTRITVSGFGINNNNQALDLPGVLHIGETPFLDRTDYEFVAGGNGLTDTCNGDSGGPAYVNLEGTRYLAGATSRAAHDSQGDCGDRGIYTLVPAYLDWLEGESGIALDPDPPIQPEPEPLPPEPEPEPSAIPPPPPLDPEPAPAEPEPSAPAPEPAAPMPEASEPEPIPGLNPEPAAPLDPDSSCNPVPDGNCEVICARVDPDCFSTPAPPPGGAGTARLQGGCVARPGGDAPRGLFAVCLLAMGAVRRRSSGAGRGF